MRFAEARSDAEDLLQVAGRDSRTRLDRAKELLKGSGTPCVRARAPRCAPDGDVGADSRRGAGGERRRPRGCSPIWIARPSVESLASTLGRDRLDRMFTAVAEAEDALDRNVSPKVVADWLAINVH
jgi:hypothetical protein